MAKAPEDRYQSAGELGDALLAAAGAKTAAGATVATGATPAQPTVKRSRATLIAGEMRCRQCGLKSPPGMRFCGACGGALEDGPVAVVSAADDDSAQRRHMTVMFCDLVGSTPLAESLDPEDFREVLTGYQQACVRAIERFDGFTARYVGDGLVVYFGYPRAHEDDAQRAVHAALGILDELGPLNSRLREQRDLSLQVRIGIHTGVVVAGEMGAGETRAQHDIVGEMPHIAARLESIAPPGSVVISDATYELVDGYFETESLGEKELKGISRPIGVHRVVRATGVVGRLEVTGGRRLSPVVGRDDELAQLAELWGQVEAGRGAVAHVTGEAGIGKSRLVRALSEMIGEQVGSEQVWQCSAHYGSTALYPVIRLLERLLGIERTETAEHQLGLIDQAAADAALDPVEAGPLLADLLSVRGASMDVGESLSPRDARTAILRVLESLLVTDTNRHPLLFVVEDVQWADPTTLELLGRIAPRLRGLPVLCVLTFRPEFEPPRTLRAPALEIELGPLTSDQVRALATAASQTELEPDVLDRVDSAADGVPLFVEEMLKVLEQGNGAVVPPTLEGLLTERLDRLPDLSDVIDKAAILGREFDRKLLGALDPRADTDLDGALAQLAEQDVLRVWDGGGSRFEFTHALLQEAAYERILRRRRRALHSRVAGTLVTSFAEVAEREPEVVAHHWSCAAEPEKAIRFWHAAGRRALERAAYLEAAEHFRRGLEALDAAGSDSGDDLEREDFLTHLAASLQAGRGYAAPGVEDAYARARAACERAGNDDRLVLVTRGQWMFHLLRGQYGDALELADEMLALGERGDRPVHLAEGHLYRGLVHMYLANFDLAREHLNEAFTRYERPDRSDLIYEAQGDTGVGALAYLSLVLWNLGYAGEARERSDLSIERAGLVGGPVTRAQAWGMRSFLHLSRLELPELAHWVDKTRAHSIDNDIGYWRAVSSLLAAWLRGRAGELELGTARLEESLDVYVGSGSRLGLPHLQILLADLRLVAGDRRGALDVLRVGEEYIEESGERFSESELFRFKARALMTGDTPDPGAATAAYEAAIAAAHEQNAKLLELRAATRLTELQHATGQAGTVIDRVVALCEWFGPESELVDVVRARNLVASESVAR
jgi:class 3 adenylate cyclase/tetratricopeptide (TPR) repeat protein